VGGGADTGRLTSTLCVAIGAAGAGRDSLGRVRIAAAWVANAWELARSRQIAFTRTDPGPGREWCPT